MNGRSDIGGEWVVVVRSDIEVPTAVVIGGVLDCDLIENRGCCGRSIERCTPSDFVATVGKRLV